LIGDFVSALVERPAGDHASWSPVRPVSVEFDLPIETRVVPGPDGLFVRADFPQTRTRTAFDLPLGRLSIRLAAEVTP
jgi:hypothetical protein